MKRLAQIVFLYALSMAVFNPLAFSTPLPQKPHIYVEGSAKIEVEPNTITFSVELEKTDFELEVAKSNVDNRSVKLIETCKDLGIPTENIATTTLKIYPAFKYKNGEQTPNGTSVSRKVDIKLEDLSIYGKVMAALVQADISKTISTQLSISNEDEFTDKALEAALADANKRAETIAKSQKKQIIGIHSISEFRDRRDEVYQLIPSREIIGQASSKQMAYDISRTGNNEPFQPGRMIATAKVYVVYLIKNR